MRIDTAFAYLSAAEEHPTGHFSGHVLLLVYYWMIILVAIVLVIGTAVLVVSRLKRSGVLHGEGDRLLETASRRGMILPAEVVGLEAVKTQKLELRAFKKSRGRSGDPQPMRKAYHNLQDSRVSYKPTVRVMLDGKKRELEYFRFVSDRELRLREGQTVRICIDPKAPDAFVIVGDHAAYRYLNKIVR